MLNGTFRLLAAGGQNTICNRAPTLSGCGVNVPGLGFTKASRILFDTVTTYLSSTARWEDLAYYASQAAFFRYNTCRPGTGLGDPATVEQDAVNKAFGAIGYPRSSPPLGCNW